MQTNLSLRLPLQEFVCSLPSGEGEFMIGAGKSAPAKVRGCCGMPVQCPNFPPTFPVIQVEVRIEQ